MNIKQKIYITFWIQNYELHHNLFRIYHVNYHVQQTLHIIQIVNIMGGTI
jgi:hypothetical protein